METAWEKLRTAGKRNRGVQLTATEVLELTAPPRNGTPTPTVVYGSCPIQHPMCPCAHIKGGQDGDPVMDLTACNLAEQLLAAARDVAAMPGLDPDCVLSPKSSAAIAELHHVLRRIGGE